jgi:hypothetical protein
MLEYFAYKKYKKNKAAKTAAAEAAGTKEAVLSPTDETFLKQIASEADGATSDDEQYVIFSGASTPGSGIGTPATESDTEGKPAPVAEKGKGSEKKSSIVKDKKSKRWSVVQKLPFGKVRYSASC